MQTQAFRRAALCPKPSTRDDKIWHPLAKWFDHLAGKLLPAERRALREIAENGDLIVVENETYLFARVKPETVDALAAFEALAEDLEDGDEDRCAARDDEMIGEFGHRETEDDEPNGDQENVVGGATREFLSAARARFRAKGLQRRSMAFAVLSPSGEIVRWERRNFTSMRGVGA